MKKIVLYFVVLVSLTINCFADEIIRKDKIGDSEKAFRNALYSFENADYGKALKYSEDAILFRRQRIEYEIYMLKESLSSRAAMQAGDNIKDLLKVLNSRKEYEAINIIEHYLKKKGNDFFNNSVENLLSYMSSLSVFPEADKLIGDIYKLEGEYSFAEEYYLKALDNSSVLDIPDEKYAILYMLAEISEFKKDYENYELRLLNVLADDEVYKNTNLIDSIVNTISKNDEESFEKFFKLYRADNYISLNAYIKLANYYFDVNEKNKALQFSALAVITAYTKINESLKSRNTEYNSTTLDVFLQECGFYPDIIEWGSQNQVWKNFTSLAKISISNGYNIFAKDLLKVLVNYLPEPYWQKDAVLTLEKIN